MPTTIVPAPTFVLCHPTASASYSFHPRGEVVGVVHIRGHRRDVYPAVPLDEARALWRSLRNKGYERF